MTTIAPAGGGVGPAAGPAASDRNRDTGHEGGLDTGAVFAPRFVAPYLTVMFIDAIVRVEFYGEGEVKSPEGRELEVRSEVTGGVAVYRIIGRIDALTSRDLESAVGADGTSRIIFDMSDVDFISSAGLRVILVTAKNAAAAKGGLSIFGVQPAVNEVFEISGVKTIIPVASDEAEARAKLGA
jgi:anti-anti-sigma factor